MKNTTVLTDKEKQSIKVLNYVASFDGIILNPDDIKYILRVGIENYIAKCRKHLVSIVDTYPIKIKY
jgi:hypothetical protein